MPWLLVIVAVFGAAAAGAWLSAWAGRGRGQEGAE